MNYGGTNDIIDNKNRYCPRCGKSTDTHKPFPFVSSGTATAKLLAQLQQALDDSAMTAAVKAYQTLKTTTMIGSAVATIGSSVRQYVTFSGTGVDLFAHLDRKYFGKDVILITAQNALVNNKFPNNPAACKLDSSLPTTFTPVQPVAQNRNRDYPVGSCAAPKLLAQIYNDAFAAKAQIQTVELAEILWFDTTSGGGHNRDWSTGQIVMSCDTCKQVLPQMLCSN